MDTTKKYIEMCEKAAKDLGGAYDKPPEVDDCIAMEQTVGERDFRVMTGLQMWHQMAPYDPITSDRLIIKLYKQDQLQKMIDHPLLVLDELHEFLRAMDAKFIEIDSLEQLWLAFVMKEKYNKTWNGKDWVNA